MVDQSKQLSLCARRLNSILNGVVDSLTPESRTLSEHSFAITISAPVEGWQSNAAIGLFVAVASRSRSLPGMDVRGR